jgi:phosphoribosylformylglycinamidine synthase subunit PurL
VDLSDWQQLPLRALLFGEAQGRVIVSSPDALAVLAIAAHHGVKATTIGTVHASSGALEIVVGSRTLHAPVTQLAEAYHETIPRIMQRSASAQDVALASDSVT